MNDHSNAGISQDFAVVRIRRPRKRSARDAENSVCFLFIVIRLTTPHTPEAYFVVPVIPLPGLVSSTLIVFELDPPRLWGLLKLSAAFQTLHNLVTTPSPSKGLDGCEQPQRLPRFDYLTI